MFPCLSLHSLYLICIYLHLFWLFCIIHPFSFHGYTHGLLFYFIYNPSSFFVLTEDGSSFAPKRLIEFVVNEVCRKGFLGVLIINDAIKKWNTLNMILVVVLVLQNSKPLSLPTAKVRRFSDETLRFAKIRRF